MNRSFILFLVGFTLLLEVPGMRASETGAIVAGTVIFKGTVPVPQKLQMSSDLECRHGHKKTPMAEQYVIGDGGKLANVFVYIKSGLEGKTFPVPTEKAKLDQMGCIYHPHILGVQAKQEIEVTNSDATLHNVNAAPKVNRRFNFAQPVKGMKTTKKFDEPELMVPLKCDVHPWMKSYVNVVAHPFFAVSSEAGTFEIKNLPAGSFTIEAVHEELGETSQKINVKDGESKKITFTFSKP